MVYGLDYGEQKMNDVLLVLTTVASEQQAICIAEELMQQELCACVNILPTMRTIYRFKGRVFDDEENLLIIKTTDDLYDDVVTVICQMHTYEVPEIAGIRVDQVQSNFLNWVSSNVHHHDEVASDEESG